MSTDTLELTDLEHIEAPMDDDKCEAIHGGPGTPPCTIVATAMGKPKCLSGAPVLICQSIVDWARRGMENGHMCGDCGRPLGECWTIVPI